MRNRTRLVKCWFVLRRVSIVHMLTTPTASTTIIPNCLWLPLELLYMWNNQLISHLSYAEVQRLHWSNQLCTCRSYIMYVIDIRSNAEQIHFWDAQFMWGANLLGRGNTLREGVWPPWRWNTLMEGRGSTFTEETPSGRLWVITKDASYRSLVKSFSVILRLLSRGNTVWEGKGSSSTKQSIYGKVWGPPLQMKQCLGRYGDFFYRNNRLWDGKHTSSVHR